MLVTFTDHSDLKSSNTIYTSEQPRMTIHFRLLLLWFIESTRNAEWVKRHKNALITLLPIRLEEEMSVMTNKTVGQVGRQFSVARHYSIRWWNDVGKTRNPSLYL